MKKKILKIIAIIIISIVVGGGIYYLYNETDDDEDEEFDWHLPESINPKSRWKFIGQYYSQSHNVKYLRGYGNFYFISKETMTVSRMAINMKPDGEDYPFTVDIYMNDDDELDKVFREGTLVKDDWEPEWINGWQLIEFDETFDIVEGVTYSLEFLTSDKIEEGESRNLRLHLTSTEGGYRVAGYWVGDEENVLVTNSGRVDPYVQFYDEEGKWFKVWEGE